MVSSIGARCAVVLPLVVLKPRASLRPVAVKASSFGGRCCQIVTLTRIFCLILAVDSRGDHGRASALHKSKLLQTRMAPGSVNLVARGWFYVAIGAVATVNFTHCLPKTGGGEPGIDLHVHDAVALTIK